MTTGGYDNDNNALVVYDQKAVSSNTINDMWDEDDDGFMSYER